MSNKSIGIIGGGISGLYIANKLAATNSVTVFEGHHWGGDVQYENVDGKCYPVSTLYKMPNDQFLDDEIERINIKTEARGTAASKITLPTIATVMFLLTGFVSTKFKKLYGFAILLLLLVLVLYTYTTVCFYTLGFGGDNKCNRWYKSISVDAMFATNPLKLLLDCGFSKIVKDYRSNKSVHFVSKNAMLIDRTSMIVVDESNKKYKFDKIIIACKYSDYKDIIELTSSENTILKNIEYFTFYSTLVKFKPTHRNHTSILEEDKVLGYQKFSYGTDDTVAYLLASHEPLDYLIPHMSYYKQYVWQMPIARDRTDKRNINQPTNNIFFIGKEIAGNGINHCMKYASEIIDMIELDESIE